MSLGALNLSLTTVCWLWAMAVMVKMNTGLSRTGMQGGDSYCIVLVFNTLSAAGERSGDRKVTS